MNNLLVKTLFISLLLSTTILPEVKEAKKTESSRWKKVAKGVGSRDANRSRDRRIYGRQFGE